MPKKYLCLKLKQASQLLEFSPTYGPQKVKNLIARGKIEGTCTPSGESNTKNVWCVSFDSVEAYRIKNKI